jgi:hypothetical protein
MTSLTDSSNPIFSTSGGGGTITGGTSTTITGGDGFTRGIPEGGLIGLIFGGTMFGVMGLMYFISFILAMIGTIKGAQFPDIGSQGGLIAVMVLSWLFMPTPVVNLVLASVLVHMVRTH